MRSSKPRSRNKNNNRNRNNNSGGNIINRVFDSSGPEGKVRGTPQQIIDKYQQLTRDANMSNDRVAAENFQQHGEHYIRILGEAQREMDAKREQQEREHRERQQARADQQQNQNQNQQPQNVARDDQDATPAEPAQLDPSTMEQPDVIDVQVQSEDSGLVETPEQPKPKRKPRAPRKPKPAPEASNPEAAE